MTEKWPSIGVLIPTYNRPNIVVKCIASLGNNLIRNYPGEMYFYVSMDGDFDSTISAFMNSSLKRVVGRKIHLIQGPNKGLGANLNHLLKVSEQREILMSLDDDHILKEPINLKQHVKELLTNPKAGWIRLYWCQGHEYTASLEENYWRIHWDSPFLYIPSFRPHLKHRKFHDYFGMYPENLKLGETEEAFCHQCKNKAKKALIKNSNPQIPHVMIPLNHVDHIFDHMGESWQKKGL